MDGYKIYELTISEGGRTLTTLMASFRNLEEAAVYGKNRAFKEHKDQLVVYPNGSVAIYSEKS